MSRSVDFVFLFWHYLIAVSVAAKLSSGVTTALDFAITTMLVGVLAFGIFAQNSFVFRAAMFLLVTVFSAWNLIAWFAPHFSNCGCFGNVPVSTELLLVLELVTLPLMVLGLAVTLGKRKIETKLPGKSGVWKIAFGTVLVLLVSCGLTSQGVLQPAMNSTLGADKFAMKIASEVERQARSASEKDSQRFENSVLVFISNECKFCKIVVPLLTGDAKPAETWLLVEVNGKPIDRSFASRLKNQNLLAVELERPIQIQGSLPQVAAIKGGDLDQNRDVDLKKKLKVLLNNALDGVKFPEIASQ